MTLLVDRPVARGRRSSNTSGSSRPGRRAAAATAARAERLSALVVGVVVALAGSGAVLAAVLLTQGSGAAAGSVLRTDTGTLEVGALSVSSRHDPKDMIGMPAGHDDAGHATVLVPVTLSNTTEEPVTYSHEQFRLIAGDTEVAPAAGVGATTRTLRPHAAITLRLTFTAPTADSSRLRYSPAAGDPVATDLGPIVQHPAAGDPSGPARPGADQPKAPAPAASPSGGHPAPGSATHGQAGHGEGH